MSIKLQFANKIFNGEKEVEFRKIFPLKFKNTNLIFVYCTNPIRKIIGHFSLKQIIKDSINNLWEKYKNIGGISEESFFDYFRNKKIGYALEIDKYRYYNIGIDLSVLSPNKKFFPSQSYIYLDCQMAFKILEIANQ